MDLFKLLFEHDLRTEDLVTGGSVHEFRRKEASIADFMKPDPTWSRFLFSGTRLTDSPSDPMNFGLSELESFPLLIEKIESGMGEGRYFTRSGRKEELREALEETAVGEAILWSRKETPDADPGALQGDSGLPGGEQGAALREILEAGDRVLRKEMAEHGYDLHLFTARNIYPDLFWPLKELLGGEFRFFSMNGKRIRTERNFYFEKRSLNLFPHGVEEVFPGTML